jgi:hypothetical protein
VNSITAAQRLHSHVLKGELNMGAFLLRQQGVVLTQRLVLRPTLRRMPASVPSGQCRHLRHRSLSLGWSGRWASVSRPDRPQRALDRIRKTLLAEDLLRHRITAEFPIPGESAYYKNIAPDPGRRIREIRGSTSRARIFFMHRELLPYAAGMPEAMQITGTEMTGTANSA